MKLPIIQPSVDPRTLGARCDECPLKEHTPVLPTVNNDALLILCGEAPGKHEVEQGEPFVGPSGWWLNNRLSEVGLSRKRCHVTNALLCRPPKKFKTGQWKQALTCCRPRLEAELAQVVTTQVLAMGGKANWALADPDGPLNEPGSKDKITSWWGGYLPGPGGKSIMPAVHPAFVLRAPHYTPVFKIALQRAAWPVAWVWPELIITPGPRMIEGLKEILASHEPIGVDIENIGDPMAGARIRCIGVATSKLSISVPLELNPVEEVQLLGQILAGDNVKVMHNAQHDLLGMKVHNIHVGGKVFDTLLAHAVVAPALPHDLGFTSACYLHAPRWKTEHKVEGDDRGLALFAKEKIDVLCLYNAKDAWVGRVLKDCLEVDLQEVNNGEALYNEQLQLGHLALHMREHGVLVDRGCIANHRGRLDAELGKRSEHATRGKDTFTTLPRSLLAVSHVVKGKQLKSRSHIYVGPYRLGETGQHRDLKRLFFGHFGIQPTSYTEEGEPQLDDDVLLRIAQASTLAGKLARTILEYRQFATLKSRYVDGLPIMPNGRVHATWKCYGTVTGRWSSQDPNMQNLPGVMRDIFLPDPGKVLVSTDFSQLELIIVGMLAGDEPIISWYDQGLSVHLENARTMFKDRTITKDDRRYKLTKNVVYGLNYGAGAEKIWQQMLPKSPGLSLQEVRQVIRFWFNSHPAIEVWQQNHLQECRQRKYVEAPLSGRREHFYGEKIEPTKALNFPIQSTAGDIMNKAILTVASNLLADEQILFQIHDEIDTQGADEQRIKAVHEDAMQQTITLNGCTIKLRTETKCGKDLRNLQVMV